MELEDLSIELELLGPGLVAEGALRGHGEVAVLLRRDGTDLDVQGGSSRTLGPEYDGHPAWQAAAPLAHRYHKRTMEDLQEWPFTWEGRGGPFTILLAPGVFAPTRTSFEMAEGIRINPGDTVIDVGSGSGVLSFVAARLGAARVFGTDVNPKAIEMARRNAVLVLMSIELMLNAVNINLVVFNLLLHSAALVGQVFALFVITIAAAELGVGLAIVILIFRNRSTVSIDEVSLMKW